MSTEYVTRFNAYFECLGSIQFAQKMSQCLLPTEQDVATAALELDESEVLSGASFHGDIGQAKRGLDAHATDEQKRVFESEESTRLQLQQLGSEYLERFGVKFLVSAKGKTADELLTILQSRLHNSREVEWKAARVALGEIAWKRMVTTPFFADVVTTLPDVVAKHDVPACQVTVSVPEGLQTFTSGEADGTLFEMASLSKSVGSALAIEYFSKHNIPLNTPVNQLLADLGVEYRLTASPDAAQGAEERVTLHHLMRHTGLNLHYVKGIPLSQPMPDTLTILGGLPAVGLEPTKVIFEPGTHFKYSGAGFIVLQYILEQHSKLSIEELARPFLDAMDMKDFQFDPKNRPNYQYATGRKDNGEAVEDTRLMFPAFAAGATSTTTDMHKFLQYLTAAYHSTSGSGPISHATARLMLFDQDSRSLECLQFMGCKMGTGIFVIEGEVNKFMIHQGANDGFRVMFLHCFEGPDCGKGLTAVCTADVKGVSFIANVAQEVMFTLNVGGIDFEDFVSSFSVDGLKQEEVVNKGYCELLFRQFRPDRAERILRRGPRSKWSDYNVAVGGKVQYVTNDRFARVENLLHPDDPIFEPELFGRQGKVMDSWESIRHNPEPRDEMAFTLQNPSPIRFASLSTMWHWGNHSPFMLMDGKDAETGEWVNIMGETPMDGHSYRLFDLRGRADADRVFSEIKVQTMPDGGFSRLGLYADLPEEDKHLFTPEGASQSFKEKIPETKKPMSLPYDATPQEIAFNRSKLIAGEEVDVANMALGGDATASNQHYGLAKFTVCPYPPLNMFDGLESARSRIPNSAEKLVVTLAWAAPLHRIDIDFTYFVNNNPLDMEVFATTVDGTELTLFNRQKTKQYAHGHLSIPVKDERPLTKITCLCYPCGGMNRLKAWTKTLPPTK